MNGSLTEKKKPYHEKKFLLGIKGKCVYLFYYKLWINCLLKKTFSFFIVKQQLEGKRRLE